ncbi:cadmium-translocating P-type ATPase [Mucilaginibacter sp. Bleaf8]|uniref:heavy metal translocating P-type ATPase n=1 Tax=Mucilaginibacter sp. Bleaf8 TaxID=2834430 RepID=UPI001BCFEAD1|nr:heavy metal translocating P-type ATPase [Mucilaginibacter sp. Bleaf8]MBS7565488.1 cadmium-translocating P-type ATPase [Mucilaginibacter sp. Bleaf8]
MENTQHQAEDKKLTGKPSEESPTAVNNERAHEADQHAAGGHDHDEEDETLNLTAAPEEAESWLRHWPLLTALLILAVMLTLEYGFKFQPPFPINLIIFLIAFGLSGYNVLAMAWRKAKHFDFFNEFFLMSVATVGAFSIGSYSEGVAVMVFYSIGEWFQDAAVNRAKKSIKALLDIRPDKVTVMRDGKATDVDPKTVQVDEIIQVKAGEKVALDGELYSDAATFNTAALTGESKPDTKRKGEKALAGMINLDKVSEVQVKALFKDSKLSQILEMVQDATARKSQTQLFISRFAKIYTPIVFALAVLVCFAPYFFVDAYNFHQWFYRALVFLVISCPCALVVSIPLGYFGGIGLASRNGILFKGSNFLDVMTKINTVIMDKTGTLTKGVFKLQEVVTDNFDKNELVRTAAAIEANSTHPIAKAVVEYAGNGASDLKAENVEEISGHGLKGTVNEKTVLAGNAKLLEKFDVAYPSAVDSLVDTVVVLAVDNRYAGYITIADEIKEDAKEAIERMHNLKLQTVMLSGDKQAVVDKVAKTLGIDKAFGDLLPDGKVQKVQGFKDAGSRIAFVGDGVNDAPVVALADAGIAMGGLGSDATIETADIVIQNDQPSKITTAIQVGKITSRVVWQNIAIAMIVKVIVLVLGAGGVANLWEAVIADVGVALLAILNAVRIQKMKLD